MRSVPVPPGAEAFVTARMWEPDAGESDSRPTVPRIVARPYVWRDPAAIPPRQWLHAGHYVRRYVSATIAQGGLGKSSLQLVEAVGMAIGRNLLGGGTAAKPLRVWYWNLEDPIEELERRVGAILLHYNIDPAELAGRLFLNSGRDDPLVLAEMSKSGVVICSPISEGIEAQILACGVDVLIVDPFVSSHRLPENDNTAIDAVAKEWARIAGATNIAIDLAHHVRKPAGTGGDVGVNDARGASALIGAARSTRVLNRMSAEEASAFRVDPATRRSYFRADKGEKDNLLPPAEKADWRKFASVPLGNATPDDPQDWIGVVEKWEPANAFDGVCSNDLYRVQKRVGEGEWREDVRAKNWVGIVVAEVLDLDAGEPAVRAKIKSLLRVWIKNGALKIVKRKGGDRHECQFIEVGEWAA